MYKGKNPTAIQSKRWLSDALIQLMNRKNYHSISIIDICKQADLSRQTFYNLFSSKEEILHFCLEEQYKEEFNRLKDTENISMKAIVGAFANVLENNRMLLKLMIENHLDSIITAEIANCVTLFANCFSVQSPKNHTFSYGVTFLSGALAETLVFWFKQDEPVSLEVLSEMLLDMISGNYYHISDKH